jgi:hypothetical protein
MLDAPEENDYFGRTLAVGDLNGDGDLDLVIGVPYEGLNTGIGIISDSGWVQVLYGASGWLTTTGTTEYWHQGSTNILGTVEAFDWFGAALAIGDFDGDGYDDLAVGVPGQDVGQNGDAGVVNVIYGSASGLTAAGNQLWRQGADGITDSAESGDQFGYSLASADFDGDGYDDLAIGVPYEDKETLVTVEDCGYLNVIYGSSSGLTGTGSQWFDQGRLGTATDRQEDDRFGHSLAGGDFDGDGYADLAIGVPYEDVMDHDDAGAVSVVYGSGSGLAVNANQLVKQSMIHTDEVEDNDRFGYHLAAGDFDADGYVDLAVGVPYEGVGSSLEAGAVNVFYGHNYGFSAGGLVLEQDNPELGDHFGMALAAGHFNVDPYADLAIGAPGEDLTFFVTTYVDAGAVDVVYGSATGITLDGRQFWHQDCPSIEDVVEAGDEFGSALAAYSEMRYEVYLPLVVRD